MRCETLQRRFSCSFYRVLSQVISSRVTSLPHNLTMPFGSPASSTGVAETGIQTNRRSHDCLLSFVSTRFDVAPEEDVVELSSDKLYSYPYVYLTGHGNVHFTDSEAARLRRYLIGGGFLHVDDNYGLDRHIRREMKKVFPEREFVELPFSHPIYHTHFEFPNGLPKIHEHDGKPAQGFGIVYEGRLLVFYSYESDLGDGWESPSVHNDPAAKRRAALEMGANILTFAMLRSAS